jgi:hypothetical protein
MRLSDKGGEVVDIMEGRSDMRVVMWLLMENVEDVFSRIILLTRRGKTPQQGSERSSCVMPSTLHTP